MTTSPNFSRVATLLNHDEMLELIEFWDEFIMNNRKLCSKMGSEVLLTALHRDPALLSKFHIFRGLTLEEIAHHRKLAAHGQYVVYTFANIVSQMDDLQLTRSYVETVVKNHFKRDMTADHFELFFSLLLAVLAKRIPPDVFTNQLKDINRRGFTMLLAVFRDCFEEEEGSRSLRRCDSIFETDEATIVESTASGSRQKEPPQEPPDGGSREPY